MTDIRHILGRGAIQPKLKIGAPDDAYEREADRVADRVMSMAGPDGRPPPMVRRPLCNGCATSARRNCSPSEPPG